MCTKGVAQIANISVTIPLTAAITEVYVKVYLKGAEVVRMYETIVGRDGFRKGLDLYFERHDGTAATCDDFRAAMADANHLDLTQFEEWYSQPGTPEVTVAKQSYDPVRGELTLEIQQNNPAVPGAPPLHVPIAVGVLGQESKKELSPTRVLELREATQEFVFEEVTDGYLPLFVMSGVAGVGAACGICAQRLCSLRDLDCTCRFTIGSFRVFGTCEAQDRPEERRATVSVLQCLVFVRSVVVGS